MHAIQPGQNRATLRTALTGWTIVGGGLLAGVIGLTYASPLFGYSHEVHDMPVFWLAGGLAIAGAGFLTLPSLIRAARHLTPNLARGLLWAMLAAGLAMRLLLFASEPALEDDYQRYLWDGALTANGLNPYASTPEAAKAADPQSTVLGGLARESGLVLGRVNHPRLRTLYPPVAQGAFALAHWLGPWSLSAWRALILLCDLVSISLLLVLLRDLGRSKLWAALYWWNPIVLKELYNSAHMDALVIPFVLGALLLAIRKHYISATASLTLAAGVKLWPVILLPLVWRGLFDKPKRLMAAIALTLCACALIAWPILAAGLDPSSGLIAYAGKWKTNSALFPLIEGLAGWMLDAARIDLLNSGFVARFLIALALCAVVAWQCRAPADNAQAYIHKALIITASLFLLFPAQFPWYYTWVLPLLACRPVPGLLILTATLPLYYTAFYFLSHESYRIYLDYVVWLIWLPAWALLAWNSHHRVAALRNPLLSSHNARGTP